MKKNIKIVLSSILALIVSAGIAFAHPPSVDERVEKMQEKLGLDDSQSTKLREIFSNARAKCEGSDERKERRECMKGQRDEVRAAVEGVLTAEQLEKHKEFMKKRREKRAKEREKRRERFEQRDGE